MIIGWLNVIELNTLYNEDHIITLSRMPDNFLDLTVTSPPYGSLRDYKGYNFCFESLAKELFRATKNSGVLVWVVGDQTINGDESGSSFEQALFFKSLGFKLHDTMIYEKHNFSNPSITRYHQMFEYMFVFVKGKLKTFNPIKDKKNAYGGKVGTWGKNTSRNVDGSMSERKAKINSEYGMRGNIWKYRTEQNPIHPAQFPEQLAEDHIISWTNKNDIVYDPMAGGGTTLKMAMKLRRNYIGSEISSDYCVKIKKRLNEVKQTIDLENLF